MKSWDHAFLGNPQNEWLPYPPGAKHTLAKVKFIYSEKSTKFCEIFLLLLTTVHTVKSKEKISQNCVAFSEYMTFK
jgi:hypothetical protein